MHNKRSGQALVELIAALVVILVLTAGLIQIGSMGVSQSSLMAKARREAGQKAMRDEVPFAGPQYIGSCTPGDDGIPFSRDDGTTLGNPGLLQIGIAGYARPEELALRRPDNGISAIADSALPQELLGLVDGEATMDFALLPIMRDLIYNHESVALKGKAWMTWTKGIY